MVRSRNRKILVVDANVARSAGTTENPMSKRCRNTLQEILTICHKIIFSEEIKEEWNQHSSLFSQRWLSSMCAKKKFIYQKNTHDQQLRGAIAQLTMTDKQKEELLKDVPFVEAALQGDGIIISQDEKAHELMEIAARSIPQLTKIAWFNPVEQEEETTLEWLQDGAEKDGKFIGRSERLDG